MSSVSEPSNPSVEIRHRHGQGPVVLLCEHASHHIPACYQGLGLAPAHRRSHAAWDPGARGVAVSLCEWLDAPLVASRVSRLVYDCNRPPEAETAMPARVEVIDVPGNRGLDAAERAARVEAVYRPFCDAVTGVLADRRARAIPSVLITLHSFTPSFHGERREVEIGILHDADRRLADAMLAEAHRLSHRCIRRNDPYGPEDGVTHSLKLHGIGQGIANVMIEVRNDLLATPEDQQAIAEELCRLIHPALATLGVASSLGEGAPDA
ncbi:N-formylglutamate amidohydrolase [Halomonas saccharevitans]|uniref:Predicted N-formylglutamate amidohydrolase n=1 Tax=Halomonas saccharevitans TaxID=416872 RepID=A0A1I6X1I8_9GAMM|nr:N-formylglutamate amidohydrolase [Halomonas saccharevitans]SFT32170.1 Predicted N-formylglutamate amidohydrolase [Halomonas saccharevitans]